MDLIRGIKNIKPEHQGCVLSIGNFDGVHRGHQAVLQQLLLKAAEFAVPATVMTFEPQPLELFLGENSPARLSRLRDKFRRLEQFGLDRLLCVRFSRHFAAMDANQFIEQVLVNKLGVKFLVVGDDFHFGYRRQGNFELLQQAGKKYGFDVIATQSLLHGSTRVSSTQIRDALAAGQLQHAERLLGRPYSISGRVAHGQKLGRTIGVPTANIWLKRLVTPVKGVYAVEIRGMEQATYRGIANIGTRPTLNGERQQLEVHIFDYSGDLYGRQLEVVLKQKIRDERKFENFAALKQQIELDVGQARDYHGLAV
ncbi:MULTISPECIES: bifunctional riboflavin kinase/FAD synthetase [unclassified Motilimonas]|uniref:bifunctional riboflavin kinase/FAD synthetase n=1 Tax=Motilimonas TaxID=1914248 RepID=UPI001E5C724F|nr:MULTISPECIES: bifunctional riboflavin kinase/FAD synthetase [unclassified Motilimonas]MCE0559072.1 bifunctional riboflavin kinase/FAD synthetase [Motilimonas sp. E26]MDO6527535.1 bifunctional riboflavin kinase/FAD synthetase [Motilimonas sp. 1_MG-2023]